MDWESNKRTEETFSDDKDNWEELPADNRGYGFRCKWKFCECSNTTQLAILIAIVMVFVVSIVVFTSTMQNTTDEINHLWIKHYPVEREILLS